MKCCTWINLYGHKVSLSPNPNKRAWTLTWPLAVTELALLLQSEVIHHGHWFAFFVDSLIKVKCSHRTRKWRLSNESVLSPPTASRGDLLGRWLHCHQVPLRRHNQQKRIPRPLHQHQVPGHTALSQVTSGGRKGPRGAEGQTEGPPREAPAQHSETFGHQDESDKTEQPQDHQPHLSS